MGEGGHLSLTHPTDGVDGLSDVPTVNLCQFAAGSKAGGGSVLSPPALPAQPPAPHHPACPPSPQHSWPRCPYASFLCFSLVLASEILLWRFLSRIFCSSFFSLHEPAEGRERGQWQV